MHDQIFRAVLVAGALAVCPFGLYFRIRSQATREPLDRRQEGAFILFTLRPIGFSAALGLVAYLVDPALMAWSSAPLAPAIRWVGVALAGGGALLLLWSMKSLGPNLTDTVVTRRAHELVTSGPYRWVRHPFYDAAAVLAAGAALATANWFIGVTGTAAVALLVLRTRREETHLAARFGDPYAAYTQRTGRFLPELGLFGRRNTPERRV